MIKVYVVVRKDNQQFVRVFRTREGAELFIEDFRVDGEIVEDEIVGNPCLE
jgi:hypothetical protein